VASSIPDKIGRYQILERVGKGGMGVLYRGIDPVLDREVAIKLMLMDFSEDTEQMRPRFYREAQAAAKLQHSNIVTIFEFAEDHNTPYIVMEFLRGSSLAARMTAPLPLTLDDKLNVVAQLCGALNYAHEQGVVHRDIKPANIFILADGTAKLLDFGVAKLTTSTLTRQGDVLGSASYMSPEQVGGSESVDGRSDIFSVGVMLYELLAGRKPFIGEGPTATIVKILREDPPSLNQTAPGLPPQLVAAVEKALAKNPADRFATAGEFARELQWIRRSVDVATPGAPGLDETRFASPTQMFELQKQLDLPAPPVAAPPPAPRSKPSWLVPAGVAGVLLIGSAAVFVPRMMKGQASNGAATVDAAAPAPAAAAPAPPPAASAAPVTAPGPSAAPVESAPAAVSLQIVSVPPGAAISIDGRPTNQTTPAAVALSGPAPHKLRLSKRGFVTQEIELTEAEVSKGTASYTLPVAEVAKVPVTINSVYPVDVSNGTQVLSKGQESHQLTVPVGTKLRISSGEYLLNDTVTVTAKPLQYSTPALGRLTILTKWETCNVKVGDRILGFPPITRKQVVAGEYRVEIVCAGGGQNPPAQMVTVPPNETATVRIY
jgi:serine/threonine-protein kinase